MKRLQIILLLVITSICNAQQKQKLIPKIHGGISNVANDEEDEQVNYDINRIFKIDEVDIKPDYPCGLETFYIFFSENFKKPCVAKLEGKIYLCFIIEKDGYITDPKVLRDIGYGTGLEAIRVLNLSQKWIPAERNGQKVRSIYNLTITIE
ncbi:Gram-negative bacterial tonB protein [compost metagenome]